jgi:hypothetical protein
VPPRSCASTPKVRLAPVEVGYRWTVPLPAALRLTGCGKVTVVLDTAAMATVEPLLLRPAGSPRLERRVDLALPVPDQRWVVRCLARGELLAVGALA